MTDPLYTKDILRLAADIPLHSRLSDAQIANGGGVRVSKVSPICGSKVEADVIIADGTITQYGQNIRACALGQAAAAIMGAHIIGQNVDTMRALPPALKAFLRGERPCPEGQWAALHIFAPAKDHKGRHASILLSFEAVATAIDTILATQNADKMGAD